MDGLLQLGGLWLARLYAVYGFLFLLIPEILFAYVAVLGAAVWAVILQSRGQPPWPRVPVFARRWARLTLEIMFGLINPVLYLAILIPSISAMQFGEPWWFAPLVSAAWALLTMFWTLRLFGAALDSGSRLVRAGVRMLLIAALACLLLFAAKDAWLLHHTNWSTTPAFTVALLVVRLSPLYLFQRFCCGITFARSRGCRAARDPACSCCLTARRAWRLRVS